MSWEFPSLVQYYDASSGAVTTAVQRLRRLDEAGRSAALETIEREVITHAMALPADMLSEIAVSVTDDLYKTMSWARRWSALSTRYVQAVFGAFFGVLTERGVSVRYIVGNAFPDSLNRPLMFYPAVFEAAGLVYDCPHAWAYLLAAEDGSIAEDAEPTVGGLASWIDEGRLMAGKIAEAVGERREHLAYFEIGGGDASLDDVLELPTPAGTVTIHRDQPPDQGTTVQVRFG